MEDKNLYDLKSEMIEEEANKINILAEANGKEELPEEAPTDISELEYADGKERDDLDYIEESEKIFGTDKVSPFKTADVRLFRRNLSVMSREQLSAMAHRVAAREYSSREEQEEELLSAFRSWSSTNGFVQTSATKKAEKGALSAAFEGSTSVKELESKLKTKTLSDLQSTAARLGFNPGFDKDRLVDLIKKEYQRQS
jgi:hypothetical protein